MKRKDFIIQSSLITAGFTFQKIARQPFSFTHNPSASLYETFKTPPAIDHPFVRWWWNGDKIEKAEISRELRLLKEAGIGGVEINPIKFPANTNDLGKSTIKWLSPQWVELLQFAIEEANNLGLTCDLIVGSGWPFGAEWLQENERTQIVSVAIKRLEGPLDYEISLYELFREADPAITSPFTGRNMDLLSLHLSPVPLNNWEDRKDVSGLLQNQKIKLSVPAGSYALHALVRVNDFMEVINGAPGAGGPVLDHYNKAAAQKYLNKMSAAIGPVIKKLRCFFTDSLELEGANWCSDMAEEFIKRRGYDLIPFLPFILYKIGGMGNIFDSNYMIAYGPELNDKLNRVRYDFERTKTELIRERFAEPFLGWCRENGLKSRVQAYGRGYHPLDGSFSADIPEGETWIKKGLGEQMSEDDYRIGRAYTMINKYVSSAAHLQGKSIVSCEELTNTDRVFNETLELLKLASDQSIISGITHAVFHGFNYSPKEASFPGWVRYGTFLNERNPWWPYINQFTVYRARLATILQQGSMYADIALLSPVYDMWGKYGAQNEPFPTLVYPSYQTLVWEAIHKNGNGCDYISDNIIQQAAINDQQLVYGPRKYHTLFLIGVESLEPATAKKLFEFIKAGGRIFCIEKYPSTAVGWNNKIKNEEEVNHWVEQMKQYPDRFTLLSKPEHDFINWYRQIQDQYQLAPYVKLSNPNPFINQIRYQTKESEILFFINSDITKDYSIDLDFTKPITEKKQPWLWDIHTGERYKLQLTGGKLSVTLGPADSMLIVFDKEKKKNGTYYQPLPVTSKQARELTNWSVEWQHIDGSVQHSTMQALQDVKDIPGFSNFCGTIIYRTDLEITEPVTDLLLNLGKVTGISELTINNIPAGVQWYGRRIYPIGNSVQKGNNSLTVKVITTMGNYLKTLTDNPIAQYWTNEKSKNQPIQSMGLLGPVTLY